MHTQTAATNHSNSQELHRNGHQTFDFGAACVLPPIGRLPSIKDVERKLWLEAVPRLILESTRERNRLEGDHRRASDAVVQLLLRGKPISRKALIEQFGIPAEHV